MKKYFVLDTNVLLHNADSIHSFADNIVVLPMTVIEELDSFKSVNNEMGRNARQVIRNLDSLRMKGRLGDGVEMDNGGILKIDTEQNLKSDAGINLSIPDNRILSVAYSLYTSGNRVIFVSKDINARLKADALGIDVMDFEKQKVNFDELFAGHREIKVPGKFIDDFFSNDYIKLEVPDLIINEFVLLVDETNDKHKGLARVGENQMLNHLNSSYESVWNIKPRSMEQRIALELLLDHSVELVTLVGQAGTGKTLLALAAGLESIIKQKKYEKMLVTRPIVPLGKDIGYLPGSKDEKLSLWMQPIFDNLTYLMRDEHKQKTEGPIHMLVEKLIKNHLVELEALTYIRGRSIPGQFIIVDEAQNLTPHEIKTIISRSGEGTKMVLTGDPYQIDNPYLDSSSNGLTYSAERLKGLKIHGHITLTKSERSSLSAVAANYL